MISIVSRYALVTGTAVLLASALSAAPVRAGDESSKADSAMVLKGGEEGTVFRSLVVEGEDRIQIDFERPPLELNLDPYGASGLEWQSIWNVLERDELDLVTPYMERSSLQRSPYLPRPWLDQLASNDLVRFRPAVKGVDRWQLIIANSLGETVARFEGKGNPPKEIGWDGRSIDGDPMPPGLTYSYVLEAYDRAGNRRNFVGKGFELPAYRLETDDGFVIVFSGRELVQHGNSNNSRARKPIPILLEASNWLNASDLPQYPISIEVTARTYEHAEYLGGIVTNGVKHLLIGDPNRIRSLTRVRPDAAAHGTVAIVVSKKD